jgi:hypothetical protein
MCSPCRLLRDAQPKVCGCLQNNSLALESMYTKISQCPGHSCSQLVPSVLHTSLQTWPPLNSHHNIQAYFSLPTLPVLLCGEALPLNCLLGLYTKDKLGRSHTHCKLAFARTTSPCTSCQAWLLPTDDMHRPGLLICYHPSALSNRRS